MTNCTFLVNCVLELSISILARKRKIAFPKMVKYSNFIRDNWVTVLPSCIRSESSAVGGYLREENRIDCMKVLCALGNRLPDRVSKHALFQVLGSYFAHHTDKRFLFPPHTPLLPSHSFSSSFSHSVMLFSMLSFYVTHTHTHTLSSSVFHTPLLSHVISLYSAHTIWYEPPQLWTSRRELGVLLKAQVPLLSAVWL